VWLPRGETKAGPGFQHVLAFTILVMVGTVVGTLGTIGMPVGFNVSAFWPAMTLQVVGGLWFGGWGVLGGVFFALLSNLLSGGSAANVWGFIPANILQSGLTAFFFGAGPWRPGCRLAVKFGLSYLWARFTGPVTQFDDITLLVLRHD
jgi:hypothetical protein